MFDIVKRYDGMSICREIFTDVLYIITAKSATVMVDRDGSPLLYSKWIRYKKGCEDAGRDIEDSIER